MNDRLEHWVLIGPQGKQAGLKDQKLIAMKLAAVYMSAIGSSQGIIQLLLPKTEEEIDRLIELTDRGYTIKKVQSRQTINKKIRDAVLSDTLMVSLAVRFEREKGKSPRAMGAVNKEFSIWICNKLKDQKSNPIKDLVEKTNDELLNRTKEDWWKKQLNQRVKNLKK